MIALNLPAEITDKVARQGLASLSDSERARIPALLRVVREAQTKGLRFSSFVHAIVATDAFTMRRTSGGSQ